MRQARERRDAGPPAEIKRGNGMAKAGMALKKSLVVLWGMLFMGCGINLMVYADIGADPFTTGVIGVHAAISQLGSFSLGNAQLLVNLIFVSAAFFLDKSKIGPGTLLSALAVSAAMDLWEPVLLPLLPEAPGFGVRLLFLLLGSFIVAAGIATYVAPDFGMGAGEILPIILSEKTGWTFRILKIGNDLICFLAGVALGAGYGAGTLICLVMMGPVIHRLMPVMKKWYGFTQ